MADPFDSPLFDARMASRSVARRSRPPLQHAAHNLLIKAFRGLHAGDGGKADLFVGKALALPYDELERVDTALMAAHMDLLHTLADTMEASDADDTRWLNAALQVLEVGAPGQRDHMLRVFESLLTDWDIPTNEARRIGAALRQHPAPSTPDPRDENYPRLPNDKRSRIVLDAIRAAVLYFETLDASA